MLNRFKNHNYSGRAIALAAFVVFAMVLGGGGSNNPVQEFALQIWFAIFALAWVWLGWGRGRQGPPQLDWLALGLVFLPPLVAVLQLVPLPPSIWHALPGREEEIAALRLVGEAASWRPISLSPSRTLASLLAIIPAVFCLYAMARVTIPERRLVLFCILAMVIANALLGMVQLVAGGGKAFNLYSYFSLGWVTGLQANRNHTADVFSIGILAGAVLAAPYLGRSRLRIPGSFDRRAFAFILGGLALFLLAALAMTGSRAGISLGLVALTCAVPIAFPNLMAAEGWRPARLLAVIAVPAILLAAAVALAHSRLTDIGRVFARFSDLEGNRLHIWQDTWFALQKFWPVGVGLGGFQPAAFAAERLEVVNRTYPNRAHNELLELGLETGLLGFVVVAVLGLFAVALAWRTWRRAPQLRGHVLFGVAFLAIVVLHSLVDYPLRAMSLACLAGIAGGMLALSPDVRASVDRGTRAESSKGLE